MLHVIAHSGFCYLLNLTGPGHPSQERSGFGRWIHQAKEDPEETSAGTCNRKDNATNNLCRGSWWLHENKIWKSTCTDDAKKPEEEKPKEQKQEQEQGEDDDQQQIHVQYM
jgi:hypothetical protein